MNPRDALKVLYGSEKAFKNLLETPKFVGSILVLILFVGAAMGAEYARDSKVMLQQTIPNSQNPTNPDPWTENATFWTSNAAVDVSHDALYDVSIEFNVTNEAAISANLTNVGSVDCTDGGGYKNLTLSMKWISSSGANPENLTLLLFSPTSTDYFYRDLSEQINDTGNNEWNNFTVPLGSGVENWVNSTGQTVWSNVTGIGLDVAWSESARSNLTLRVDRLFFQSTAFEPLPFEAVTSGFGALITFVLDWIIFAIALFIGGRVIGAKGDLKTFFVIVGFSLIALAFMQVALLIFYGVIPPLYFTVDTVSPFGIYQDVVVFGLATVVLFPIWGIILVGSAMKAKYETTTGRGIAAGIITYVPYFILYLLPYITG